MSRKRCSSKNIASGKEQEEMAVFAGFFPLQISYTKTPEISAKALPCSNDFLACVTKLSRAKSFSKIQ